MSNIDTIREALEKAIENLSYYDGFDNSEWEKALASLSTIDPDAKPQEIHRDAAKLAKALGRITFTDYCNQEAIAMILAHDDAIRREYYRMGVEAALAEWKSLRITIGRDEMIDNVRQVLLGKEAEK